MSVLFAEHADDEEDDEPCNAGRAVLRIDTASPAEGAEPSEVAEPKEEPLSPSAEYADDFAPLSPSAEYADDFAADDSEEESGTGSSSESEPSSAGEVGLERRNAFMSPKSGARREAETTQPENTQAALPQVSDAEAAPNASAQMPVDVPDADLGLEPLVTSSTAADEMGVAFPQGNDAENALRQSDEQGAAAAPLCADAAPGVAPMVSPSTDETDVALPQGSEADVASRHSGEQGTAVAPAGADAVLVVETLVGPSTGETDAALAGGSDTGTALCQSCEQEAAAAPLGTDAVLGVEPLVAPSTVAMEVALPRGSDTAGEQGAAVAPLGMGAVLGVEPLVSPSTGLVVEEVADQQCLAPVCQDKLVPELSVEEDTAVCLYLERLQARVLRMLIASGAELAPQESSALPDAVAQLAPSQAAQYEVADRRDEGEPALGQTAQDADDHAGSAKRQSGSQSLDDDAADNENDASDEGHEDDPLMETQFTRRQFHGVAGTGAELAGWLLTGECAGHVPPALETVVPADPIDPGHERVDPQRSPSNKQEPADQQEPVVQQAAAERGTEETRTRKKRKGANRYLTCIGQSLDIKCGLGTWDEVHDYCNSQEAIHVQRGLLEGAHITVHDRLQRARGGLRTMTDAEDFLELMREKGDGNVGIAWRRYFDTDGDGALSFKEFCLALTAVHYQGDVLQLWQSFGGSSSNELGLEVLDAASAEYITHFYNWSVKIYGGPLEMFSKFDEDGSDSLEKSEFADGLRDDGFFEDTSLPSGINTVEKVLHNLYRLLDTHNTGVVQPDQLLFLERNPVKRAYWEKVLRKRRDGEFGTAAHDHDDQPNKALEFLKNTGFHTTRLGKQHWKMMPYNPQIGGPPPRELGPQPLFKQVASSPPTVAKGKVPRFLREFRHAKQQGKLIGKAARLAREACMGDNYVAPVPVTSQTASQRPGSAPSRGTPHRKLSSADRPHTAPGVKAVDVESAGDASRSTQAAAVAFNMLPPSSQFASLGLSPGVVGSAKISGRVKNRKRRSGDDAQKSANARKAYCGSFVKTSPKSEGQLAKLRGGGQQAVEAWKEPAPDVWLDKAEFSPTRHFDFFTANKSLAMWDHYDIARVRS